MQNLSSVKNSLGSLPENDFENLVHTECMNVGLTHSKAKYFLLNPEYYHGFVTCQCNLNGHKQNLLPCTHT